MPDSDILVKALAEQPARLEVKRCPICGRFYLFDEHTCPPAWLVRLCDWPEDEADRVFAATDDAAAITFAEGLTGCNPEVATGTLSVLVQRCDQDGDWQAFEVAGEARVSFSARRAGAA